MCFSFLKVFSLKNVSVHYAGIIFFYFSERCDVIKKGELMYQEKLNEFDNLDKEYKNLGKVLKNTEKLLQESKMKVRINFDLQVSSSCFLYFYECSLNTHCIFLFCNKLNSFQKGFN